MTLAEYSRQALSTWAVDPVAEPERARTHAALMLVAESGGVAGLYQKSVGQLHPIDNDRVVDELGDVLWALAAFVRSRRWDWPADADGIAGGIHGPLYPGEYAEIALDLAATAISCIEWHGEGAPSDVPALLWYLSLLACHHDATLPIVMQRNIDKLAARYPNGFTPAASIHRTA